MTFTNFSTMYYCIKTIDRIIKSCWRKKHDPDGKIVAATINIFIYGVKTVGHQWYAVIKLLSDKIWMEFPEVSLMLEV